MLDIAGMFYRLFVAIFLSCNTRPWLFCLKHPQHETNLKFPPLIEIIEHLRLFDNLTKRQFGFTMDCRLASKGINKLITSTHYLFCRFCFKLAITFQCGSDYMVRDHYLAVGVCVKGRVRQTKFSMCSLNSSTIEVKQIMLFSPRIRLSFKTR